MNVRSPTLSLAVAQPETVSHDLAGNVDRHAALVRIAGVRVMVFPELSLTGYEFEAAAVDLGDRALQPLVDACRGRRTTALAGAPVRSARGDHIAMLAFDADGPRVAYHKMWLGEAEAERFVPGDEPAVIEIDGWRVGLAICKDTGHPEQAAVTASLGIDVYVAGVLEHATDAHITVERAKRVASDHGVWVATASFAGPTGEGYVETAGGSAIWHPDGTFAARLGQVTDTFAAATLTQDS